MIAAVDDGLRVRHLLSGYLSRSRSKVDALDATVEELARGDHASRRRKLIRHVGGLEGVLPEPADLLRGRVLALGRRKRANVENDSRRAREVW